MTQSSTVCLPVYLDLPVLPPELSTNTPGGWEAGDIAQKERDGERVGREKCRAIIGKSGVCSRHWPASHSPPSAAHSLGWQPTPCRSCWPPSLPGWWGWREKKGEAQSWERAHFKPWCCSAIYNVQYIYLAIALQSWGDIFELFLPFDCNHPSIPLTEALRFPKWEIFGNEAIDQQQCCKTKSGQLLYDVNAVIMSVLLCCIDKHSKRLLHC